MIRYEEGSAIPLAQMLALCEHVQNTVLLSDRGNEPLYERFGFQVADNPYFQAMTKHGTH